LELPMIDQLTVRISTSLIELKTCIAARWCFLGTKNFVPPPEILKGRIPSTQLAFLFQSRIHQYQDRPGASGTRDGTGFPAFEIIHGLWGPIWSGQDGSGRNALVLHHPISFEITHCIIVLGCNFNLDETRRHGSNQEI
jgi:hypothetical protein